MSSSRGNSLICLFCNSPYTPEDYQRHLKPHEDFIKPCLLLAAGAYCATSFELEVRKMDQDLRFLPCTKFSPEFNCTKKLQATVDCFRENFDSRGFLQVSNSAMTKCSICRTPNNTYCALFKPNAATARIFGGNLFYILSHCPNVQIAPQIIHISRSNLDIFCQGNFVLTTVNKIVLFALL